CTVMVSLGAINSDKLRLDLLSMVTTVAILGIYFLATMAGGLMTIRQMLRALKKSMKAPPEIESDFSKNSETNDANNESSP
ncbi:MAG: hypothetical protein P1V97_32515, partial [Planctomycetota bacterium]|nr:hypothetical protein [Planctomycetota bacterium]